MYIAILGRQPALGMAELERLHGSDNVHWFSNESATVKSPVFDFNRLGGSLKAGRVVMELNGGWGNISRALVEHYSIAWQDVDHKITLGLSAYGFGVTARDVQKTGILLKQRLKKELISLRLVPNEYPALNTAASHHNKLGLSPTKVELLVVKAGNGAVIVAESVGAQNITAIAARDQARPHTDAFVGMLPPKLARLMLNLSGVNAIKAHAPAILDPFCGTGVVLQEALLDGCKVHGSDLSEKMVSYTTKNLAWLQGKFGATGTVLDIRAGDAMSYQWAEAPIIDAVVSETYLGQPFSAPPSPAKLTQVQGNCNHIISEFLKNIGAQIKPGTTLVLAIPAWRSKTGSFTHLPLISNLSDLGYTKVKLKNIHPDELTYCRDTQVVARELLLLVKS